MITEHIIAIHGLMLINFDITRGQRSVYKAQRCYVVVHPDASEFPSFISDLQSICSLHCQNLSTSCICLCFMMSSIDVSIKISHDYLFFVLIDSIHHKLRDSFKALYYFILRVCADWHVDYMELCIPYFNSYAPSLFQQVLWVVNDVMFDVIFNVETNSPTSPYSSFMILNYSLIPPQLNIFFFLKVSF